MKTTTILPKHKDFKLICSYKDFFEFVLKKNKLRVLLHHIPDTGVVTANIVYRVGSKYELPGYTGLAHMLEHMLFKPTSTDLANKRPASIMTLERYMGANINASTWKDRTNYYATIPTKLLQTLLQIQADQMQNVVLTDKNLAPELTTVLSEFDMYNSDPYFALVSAVSAVAYNHHPYRHETIGWRSDIEGFTAKKLKEFYHTYYQPQNATLLIIGDVTHQKALALVAKIFGPLKNTTMSLPILSIREPSQEGIRRTSVARPTTTNILSLSVKCSALGSIKWLETLVLFKLLADGTDSILYRALVDTGLITSVEYTIYPTAEPFLATLSFSLINKTSHSDIEKMVFTIINSLTARTLKLPLKKTISQILYAEPFARDSSYSIACELMEYIATDDWTKWCQIEAQVKKITTKNLLALRDSLFRDTNLTIGTFIGTE